MCVHVCVCVCVCVCACVPSVLGGGLRTDPGGLGGAIGPFL